MDLFGNGLRANEWKVLGFIGAFFLKSIGVSDLKEWTIRFKSEEIDEIFSEWENLKKY